MAGTQHYSQPKQKFVKSLNQWDFIILLLFFGILAMLGWGLQQMTVPYQAGQTIAISLEPDMLPGYAVRTLLRMGIALFFSLVFTFTIGTLAAKSQSAERIILPFIDIMQSVPVLGFLSITVLMFIRLFPGNQLGPECAAIFAIFTSQVWNMAMSFYQSLRTIPKDLQEVAKIYHLSAWQKFWRLEVPFATPGLLWNTMMSLSAGWFFVVASEAISVSNHNITLPGLGSYISLATEQSNYWAIGYAIMAMLFVIILYDQLIFRPLIAWAEKFKSEPNEEIEISGSWFLNLLQKATLSKIIERIFTHFKDLAFHPKAKKSRTRQKLSPKVRHAISVTALTFWNSFLLIGIIGSAGMLALFVYKEVTWHEITTVLYLGLITTFKVTVLIILSSLIWVPIGVWIGLKPRVARIVQPFVQVFAAFPANLLYPVLFMLIMTYSLNIEIWSAPLMILGTQWYILFNVIAGASNVPMELRLATQNYGVKGWLWWRKLILPAIFPYYVTGAMTAAGGCWNASIVADVVRWGDVTLNATGLGGYIEAFTRQGDFPRIALGIGVMCLFVTIINRLVWRKLYDLAESRYNVN
jgi:NitT/TauT family transport system permease protein